MNCVEKVTGSVVVGEVKAEKDGMLEGRKVSRWEKFKDWTYKNRKAIAITVLVISVLAALTGVGLALSAALGGSALITATTTSGVTMSGLSPAIAVKVTTAFTLAGKMLISGAVMFVGGLGIASFSGGYLAGNSHKKVS